MEEHSPQFWQQLHKDPIAMSVYVTKMHAKERLIVRELQERYEQFGDYRNKHIEEIAAKAQKVDPSKIHQPLEVILKDKGVEIKTAVDFIGGYGKHTKWLFDQHQCNVVYSDVDGLTRLLPQTFDEFQAEEKEDGSILLLKESDPSHWIYGLNTLPNEANKVKTALWELKHKGLQTSDKVQLFLGNDMLNFIPQVDHFKFAQTVDDITEPGAIIDLSGRNMIKYGQPIEGPEQIIKLFSKSRYTVLYDNAEDPISQKESAQSKKHIRVILQKCVAA